MNQIERAAELVGGVTKLAAVLGVTPQAVVFWRDGKRRLPVEACPAIERATHGAVGRKDLRPADWQLIWPELAAATRKAAEADPLADACQPVLVLEGAGGPANEHAAGAGNA